jgi:hypothetical protein
VVIKIVMHHSINRASKSAHRFLLSGRFYGFMKLSLAYDVQRYFMVIDLNYAVEL